MKTATRWIESLNEAGLRLTGFSDEIVPHLRHKGWFTDDDGFTGALRGAVLQLPSRGGQTRYLAAYADPENEGAFCVDLSVIDEKRDAALAADSMAERAAETERDYQRAWQEGSRYAQLLEDAKQARANHKALAKDLRATLAEASAKGVVVPPSICATLKAEMRSLAGKAKSALAEASAILENIGTRENAAFLDGAGLERT